MLIGHEEHIAKIRESLEIAEAGLQLGNTPVASFLLLGPTGVGKTQTARMLAKLLHGNPDHLLRIDCGEYTLEHEVAKLIGAPPGYIGHKETIPVLSTAKIKSLSSSGSSIGIILVDEFDKASLALEKVFLGILDNGSLSTGNNDSVSFQKTLILFSSNEGDYNRRAFGLSGVEGRRDIRSQVKRRPEFVNRLTGVLEYKRLTRDQLLEILQLEIEAIQDQIHVAQGVRLVIKLKDPEAALKAGNTDLYGARELKRYLQKHVTAPLARLFLADKEPTGRGEIFSISNQTPVAAKVRRRAV